MVERPGSLRLRLTVGITVVVGGALLLGALGLVLAMRRSLAAEVADAARLRATDIAFALDRGTPLGTLALTGSDDMLIQVLDAERQVVGSSANISGRRALVDVGAAESARIDVPVDDDEFVAVSAPTRSGGSVLVARSLETVDESTQVVVRLLALGLPLLLLVVAAAGWHVVGRVLAPVDAIRGEVDEISATQLHRRVPERSNTKELGRLASTMNGMLARLEHAHHRQRQFVSDASHELRSPIASIRQHAEVALAHPNEVSLAELARTVLAEDLRLQKLVDDLLLLAHIDEGTLGQRQRPVDLDDLVVAETRRLRDARPALHIDGAAVSAARLEAEPAALQRVVRNVGDNAGRHARTRVAFALSQRDGEAILIVDDDGAGIPLADRVRVFERFVRLDDARGRDDGGAGLGLAIVAEVVGAHGGSVSATDSALGGARFEIRLPVFSGRSAAQAHTQPGEEDR